jgi:hypothetical protein
MGLLAADEGDLWRTHSCVPRRDSSRRRADRHQCRCSTEECMRHKGVLNGAGVFGIT